MTLYLSIWFALLLLVGAEVGKSLRPAAAWIRPAMIAGALLAILHALVAFAVRYDWNHAIAVTETARQAESVFGVGWRGSIYVNYVFLALWLTLAWRWRHWAWRAFVIVMIVNGAVIFARPAVRPIGLALVAVLLWALLWRRQ